MGFRARSAISTTTFSKAFLVKAWEGRGSLLEYERHGFAQFFYMTLCGHLESVLRNRIKARLEYIQRAEWELLPPAKISIYGETQIVSLSHIAESVKKIAQYSMNSLGRAPLKKLLELYENIFSISLKDLLGDGTCNDIDALADLRNVFAHGRNLAMELEGERLDALKGTLKNNPLKKPFDCLRAARLIAPFDPGKGMNIEFISGFYSDAALLYFYRAVREAERKIVSDRPFSPEMKPHFMLPPLPELLV